ncbi:UNVERIFIED_CONTAM: hypothetical protein Sindi_3117000, partial [Sesamum indicum]
HGSFAPLAFQPSAMTNCANQRFLSRIPLVRTSSESAVRRPGKAPEGAVPSPSPGRHATTRSRRGSSSSSSPTADGFGTGTPVPSPQSQSFSRGYGSILPTSLAYIVPSTRGCSPWRPDAVMSTTGRGRHSVLRIFKGRRGRTGHHATCGALPAAGPYLRLSRFQDPHRRPLRPGSRPGFCGDRRALLLIGAWPLPRRPGIGRALQRHPFSGLVDSAVGHRNPASGSSRIASSAYQKWPTWSSRFPGAAQRSSRASFAPIPKSDERFARQYRCGPPPEFPLASPRSGIVHHLSGPDRRSRSVGVAPLGGDRAGQLPYALRVCSPVDSHTCQTPWSVFQDGSNGEPAGQRRERAVAEARRGRALSATIGATAFRGHIDCPGFGRRLNPRWSAPRADRRTGSRRSTSDRGASPAPIRFPPDNFKHSLTLFSKSFSSFPRGTCSLSGLSPVFSLGRNLPPDWGCIPKQPDSPTAPRGAAGSGHDGALTLSGAPFQGTWARSAAEDASPDYNSDSEAARFSSWAVPGSLAVTRGILRVIPPDLGSRSEALAPLGPTTRVERSTTTGRDERRRGIAFGPTARRCAREANVRPPRDGRGGDAMRDAQADVPWPNGFGRQLAFKDSMVHGILQFTPTEISVAESRFDIRETSPPPVHPADGATVRRTLRSVFPWRVPRRGFVSPARRARSRAPAGEGTGRGRSPRARAPILFATCSRSASAGFDNDPSAGSPTETLLRLLLPLNDKVQWTSRDVAGSEPPTSPRSEHFTGPFNR